MKISISPELESFVQSQVHNGSFTSDSEVISEALKSYQAGQVLNQLGQAIDTSRKQISD